MQRLVYVALAIIAYFYIKSLFRGGAVLPGEEETSAQEITNEMVEDPACGVYVPKRDSTQRTIAGKKFFFCGPRCAGEYEKKTSTRKD